MLLGLWLAPAFFRKGSVTPVCQKTGDQSRSASVSITGGLNEGAVSRVSAPVGGSLLSALLSALLLHSLSSFIPTEGTDFETSVSPSFISLSWAPSLVLLRCGRARRELETSPI